MNGKIAAGAVVFMGGIVSGCSLDAFGAEKVEIAIPSIPTAWLGLQGIELSLSWRDSLDLPRRKTVAPGGTEVIELPRGQARAIFVEAEYRGRSLRPCGAIWPYGLLLENGTGPRLPRLEADWAEGWVATVFEFLDERGASRNVDFPRLSREARSRLADPWELDPREIGRALMSRTFRSDMLAAESPVIVAIPNYSEWAPESALALVPPGGNMPFGLAPGYYRYYSSELELNIAVPLDGEPVILVRNLGP